MHLLRWAVEADSIAILIKGSVRVGFRADWWASDVPRGALSFSLRRSARRKMEHGYYGNCIGQIPAGFKGAAAGASLQTEPFIFHDFVFFLVEAWQATSKSGSVYVAPGLNHTPSTLSLGPSAQLNSDLLPLPEPLPCRVECVCVGGGAPPPAFSFCPWIKQLPLSLFSHGSRRSVHTFLIQKMLFSHSRVSRSRAASVKLVCKRMLAVRYSLCVAVTQHLHSSLWPYSVPSAAVVTEWLRFLTSDGRLRRYKSQECFMRRGYLKHREPCYNAAPASFSLSGFHRRLSAESKRWPSSLCCSQLYG